MKIFAFFLILVSSLFLVSCGGDDENNAAETFDYSITIMQPMADAAILAGEETHLHINFDEAEMKTVHNVSVIITSPTMDIPIYTYSEHVHEESGHHEHHADILLDVPVGTELILTAAVWPHDGDDHSGEHGEEHVGKVEERMSFFAR